MNLTDLLGVASRVPNGVEDAREHPSAAERSGSHRVRQTSDEGRADDNRHRLKGILVRALKGVRRESDKYSEGSLTLRAVEDVGLLLLCNLSLFGIN